MATRPLLSALLLPAAVVAQTQVIPASFATTAAGSATGTPFGLGTATRVQHLYAAGETGLSGPVVIRSIAVRANENTANAAKANINLQISLSTTPITIGTASATFASNHGANVSVAYTRKLTTIGATIAANPGPFGGTWPLDVPFAYDPAAGNLLIDFDIASQPGGNWQCDTPFTTAGTHMAVGTSCNGLSAASNGGALGGPLAFLMAGGQPNGVAFLLLASTLFPTPVPVPGSPGCQLYNPFPILLSTALDATGGAAVPLTVPPEPTLRGGTLYGQFLAINAALGLDTTNTQQVTLASWVVLRVANTTSNTTGSGTVLNYVGIVLALGL